MYNIAPQLDALPMLYEQHRLYVDELGGIHARLSKLYKKLTKAERRLAEKEDANLSRSQMKKSWWSRTVAKQSIEKLEAEQAHLHVLLQQCRDLITSYNQDAYLTPAMGFWTTHFPPTPYPMTPFTPFTPFPPTPWTAGPYRPCFVGQQHQPPQYWDLSMLTELQQYDGGDDCCVPTQTGDLDATNNDNLSASCCSAACASSSAASSERDDVPDMPKVFVPIKIDTTRANEHHTRRYSENAVELYNGRPGVSKSHQRGVSASPAPDRGRAL